jgi:hypothetical protein
VGLPEGTSLVAAPGASGGVQVVDGGQVIAEISVPSAWDAEGTVVPVSLSVSGDTLALSVAHLQGEYRMPIVVDPEVKDKTIPTVFEPTKSNWKFHSEPPGQFTFTGSEEGGSATAAGQHMELLYQTQGQSKIYKLFLNTYSEIPKSRSTLEIVKNGGSEENSEVLGNETSYVHKESEFCAKKGEALPCATTSGTNTNFIRFQQTANIAYTSLHSSLAGATVYISQEKPPEPGFNTWSPTIEYTGPKGELVKRENVLYSGSKGWLGPHSNTAFEVVAKDPGIGVSTVSLQDLKIGAMWLRPYEEGKCAGVQCPETVSSPYTYNEEMWNGDQGVRLSVQNETGVWESNYSEPLRVDAAPPHSIKISGLPSGDIIGEGVYKLKAEASDEEHNAGGEAVPSSGIQSLKLGIDGAEANQPTGSCSPGPCTASAEWTLNGGELGAGLHTVTIVATDNAGNVENESFAVVVHHASPMALGPGSLNPQSGNYSLGASDVSMGAGLSVTRTYSSRNLTAGTEGVFGPQWAASLDSNESLSELPNGSMLLTSAAGSQMVFARNSKGELESPKGDANLTLSVEEARKNSLSRIT